MAGFSAQIPPDQELPGAEFLQSPLVLRNPTARGIKNLAGGREKKEEDTRLGREILAAASLVPSSRRPCRRRLWRPCRPRRRRCSRTRRSPSRSSCRPRELFLDRRPRPTSDPLRRTPPARSRFRALALLPSGLKTRSSDYDCEFFAVSAAQEFSMLPICDGKNNACRNKPNNSKRHERGRP